MKEGVRHILYSDYKLEMLITGNGLFLMGMATLRMDLNFLGLEINEKVCFLLLKPSALPLCFML